MTRGEISLEIKLKRWIGTISCHILQDNKVQITHILLNSSVKININFFCKVGKNKLERFKARRILDVYNILREESE